MSDKELPTDTPLQPYEPPVLVAINLTGLRAQVFPSGGPPPPPPTSPSVSGSTVF